jgi:hypothetical protein
MLVVTGRAYDAPMVHDNQLWHDDEEDGLPLISAACQATGNPSADQSSDPRRSMLHPAYKRLLDALSVMRLEREHARLASTVETRDAKTK